MTELDPAQFPVGHFASCRDPKVVAIEGPRRDLVYARCPTCGDWTFHLAEWARAHTRLRFDVELPSADYSEAEDRPVELPIPRRPVVADGNVRHGRRRAA